MQTIQDLNHNFAIAGALSFVEGGGGLTCAEIHAESSRARVYLQGAHLTNWQPTGEEPVLFTSQTAVFAPGKAIRGGVPVVFPWFGERSAELTGARTDGPSHGFARTVVWEVVFAAAADEDVHLTLALGPSEQSREWGIDGFRVVYEMVLGRTLTLRLSMANAGDLPLRFEEALHAYLAVSDAEQAEILGLQGMEFLDKTDGFRRKRQEQEVLRLRGETDRPYLNTEGEVTVTDAGAGRKILVEKKGSKSTVVWNPGADLARKLADMEENGWRRMVCVETANVAENAVTLRPSEAHTMEARISVERMR